jgi:hypothetical protein
MTTPVIAAHIQAEALAAALRAKGFATTVFKTGPHQQHPCIQVSSGRWREARWTEYIYAAPEDCQWWFWFSSLERIAPITDIGPTADRIAFVLGLPHVS